MKENYFKKCVKKEKWKMNENKKKENTKNKNRKSESHRKMCCLIKNHVSSLTCSKIYYLNLIRFQKKSDKMFLKKRFFKKKKLPSFLSNSARREACPPKTKYVIGHTAPNFNTKTLGPNRRQMHTLREKSCIAAIFFPFLVAGKLKLNL